MDLDEPKQVVIVEPYSNFKEKIRLVKQYLAKGVIVEVYKDYLYIEQIVRN